MIGIGAALVAVSFFLVGALTPNMQFWAQILPSMILMGVGMGFLVSPLSVAVMTSAPDNMSGAASGINNAAARTSGLVAVAAFGALAAAIYQMQGGTVSFGAASDVEGHLGATNRAFQIIAYVCGGLAAFAAIVAFAFIPKPAEA